MQTVWSTGDDILQLISFEDLREVYNYVKIGGVA